MTAESALKQIKKTIDLTESYLVVEDGSRFMGARLKEEISKNLLLWGVDVKTSKEPLPTPIAVLEGRERGLGVVVVTAGSSPNMISGFKIFNKSGEPHTENKTKPPVEKMEKAGKLTTIKEKQTSNLFLKRKRQKPKKIIIGTTNETIKKISEKLFDMHTVVFKKIEKSQPYKQRVHSVQKAVMSENSDAGFLLDDSGERFFVIDDTGVVWPGEWIQTMVYQSELNKRASKCFKKNKRNHCREKGKHNNTISTQHSSRRSLLHSFLPKPPPKKLPTPVKNKRRPNLKVWGRHKKNINVTTRKLRTQQAEELF